MKPIDNNMNITPPPGTDLNQGTVQTNRVPEKPESGSTQNPNASKVNSDTLTLTRTAADMIKLEADLAKIPEIDNKRVSEIKASIANGSYQVNTEKIVDSLLDIAKGAS